MKILFSFLIVVLLLQQILCCSAHEHHHDHQHDHDHHDRNHENLVQIKDPFKLKDEKSSKFANVQHTCIHDTHVREFEKKHPVVVDHRTEYLHGVRRGEAHPQAVGNIRIALRTDDLTTAGRFCSSSAGTSPDYLGGTIACSADTVLTAAKLTTLRDKILPAAIAILQAAVRVNQVAGTINPTSTSVCSPFGVTATDVTTGMNNADLVLYVAAAPIASSSTIAWAGTCQTDSSNRPTIGKINFSPAFLGGDYDNDASYRNLIITTAVHEMLHAMGFSYSMFTSNFGNGGNSIVQTSTKRGKTVYELNSTNVLAAAKTQMGCTTLTGVELEDQGGAGTALSHFERRLFYGEIMTGISGASNVLSAITLGLLDDTGFYFTVSSQAQTLVFGNGAGCTFSSDTCEKTTAGMGKYFCQTSGDSCTYDYKSIGLCTYTTYATDITPAYFRYFSDPKVGGNNADLMDYCPFIAAYSNYQCDSTTRTASSIEAILGFSFGSSSRCFKAPDLIQSGFISTSGPYRCMTYTCSTSGYITISLPGGSTVVCPTSGLAGTISPPSGWTGTIQCPAFADYCAGLATVTTVTASTSTTASIASTATTTTTSTTTTATPSPVTTLPANVQPGYVLRIKGGFSLRTLYTSQYSQLASALQKDLSSVLGLSTSEITISLAIDNSTTSVLDTAVFVTIYVTPQNFYALVQDGTFLRSVNTIAPSWMSQTQALHLSVGANSVQIASISSTTGTTGVSMDSTCNAGCALFVVACLFGGTVLILVLVFIGKEIYLLIAIPKHEGKEDVEDDQQQDQHQNQDQDMDSNQQQQQQQQRLPPPQRQPSSSQFPQEGNANQVPASPAVSNLASPPKVFSAPAAEDLVKSGSASPNPGSAKNTNQQQQQQQVLPASSSSNFKPQQQNSTVARNSPSSGNFRKPSPQKSVMPAPPQTQQQQQQPRQQSPIPASGPKLLGGSNPKVPMPPPPAPSSQGSASGFEQNNNNNTQHQQQPSGSANFRPPSARAPNTKSPIPPASKAFPPQQQQNSGIYKTTSPVPKTSPPRMKSAPPKVMSARQ